MTVAEPALPRIGIPIRLSGLDCGNPDPVMKEAERAFDAVVDLIRQSGAEPVLIRPGTDEDLETIFAGCQGFVLPGGGDVDPQLFGGAVDDPTLFGVDPRQDRIDIAAIRFGLDNDLPILGICRGMQLLNVVYGGSLHIDLDPSSVAHVEKGADSSRDFSVHEVDIQPGTRCADAFGGAERIRIASFHHQAIDVLGEGLNVTSRADDGLIEAIEPNGDTWVLGIQWHPEADIPVAELRLPAFTALKAEAARALLRVTTDTPKLQEA